jgi:hypothetical protein
MKIAAMFLLLCLCSCAASNTSSDKDRSSGFYGGVSAGSVIAR